ncbi:MAG: alkaline phosphatase D family protein [Pseudomonadota bacterium]|uniref:Alkaline phosphatase n=1 Tax=Sphingobium xenophagum TaxID=121428 RepID=A0A249MSS0_SPHXE|nr:MULTISPECIES: alkaline phosphatase D family protein [Sphingobium]ASY44400.1 alkaline phosphatase [Sphingobium xenophagum]OUC56486.1 alkaline phosphatase [Sphingobium sp. GW456-12-10-14-TSB1]QWT15256.1 alkaline phosphatase D family protein [Sphingobium xenophagum]GBH29264.1 alkaline phosphatase D [Sphingobium xenophagum]
MSFTIDRRLLIKASIVGLAALPVPGVAQILSLRGFTHGVASGEPGANSVLLWTRYVGSGDSKLRVEVATDPAFAKVMSGGEVTARADADHTAKITVTGLQPGQWYFYRFIAPDGRISRIGRTRTLPQGDVSRFGIGLFSCSNLPFGYFNAYGHAAARDDIDLVIHCGDYLYEYDRGHYPSLEEAVPGRIIEPANEMVTLADYRLRYASYRLDPDLQALHAAFPMIAQWDDHELANDAYRDGAENHQPDKEGEWAVRKAAAEKVYREWMPVSDAMYDSFQIGTLATIFRPETRITGRDKQLDVREAIAGRGDVAKALADFRDGAWSAQDRTLMGTAQEKWLYDGFGKSKKAGTAWQILAQQVIMGYGRFPTNAADWVPANAPEIVRKSLAGAVAASQAGLPYNMDSWDGYPAARNRLYDAALGADADLVVLSGDSHNAWGYNLGDRGPGQGGGKDRVGVEFAGHSVTSPGFEAYAKGVPPADIARALRAVNPGMAFCDTSQRGYVSLEVTPQQVAGSWHFMKDIRTRTTELAGTHRMTVQRGAKQLVDA